MTTHLLLLPQMKKLWCFMYVSTAYSNAHLKRYSTVHEQLYPLREQDGREVDHAAVVDRLLAMPVEEAQQEVNQLSADIICCIVDLSIWLSDSTAHGCLHVCLPACLPASLLIVQLACLSVSGAVFVLVGWLPKTWTVALTTCSSFHASFTLVVKFLKSHVVPQETSGCTCWLFAVANALNSISSISPTALHGCRCRCKSS